MSDQVTLLVKWRSHGPRCEQVQPPVTSRRCRRSGVSGLTEQRDLRAQGKVRLITASSARSAGSNLGVGPVLLPGG